METVISVRQLVKTYQMGTVLVKALQGIDLEIERGDYIAIMGASGSGKSTLMNIIGCLDVPTSGDVHLEDKNISHLTKNQYADIRNQKIGFVFQGFNLLPRTSALENVELPLLYDRTGRIGDPQQVAKEALGQVGLGDRLSHEPNQLSGGEQQRVAIARALVNRPAIILADEPTGNLDTRTSIEIMTVFQELNNRGITILLVTHENDISSYAKRIIRLQDGRVVQNKRIDERRSAMEDLKLLATNMNSVLNSGSTRNRTT